MLMIYCINLTKLSICELIEEKTEIENEKKVKKVVTFRYLSSLEISSSI